MIWTQQNAQPCFCPHLAVTHCVLFPTKCSGIMQRINVISTALQGVCTTYAPKALPQQINVNPSSSHVVTTCTKSPALLRSQFVNGDTTFRAEPKQPSSSMDKDHSFHDDTSRNDDDLQAFKADDASDIRPEATPNNQAFVNTCHAAQTCAYPGFTYTVDQKWTAALLKVMDDINAPDYVFGLILAWARGASAEEYSFHPQGDLDCARHVTVLVKSIANATQLLPSVL